MSKWKHTDTAVDGTPLYCEDGKYYTKHAWDNFDLAYKGEVQKRKAYRTFRLTDDGFQMVPAGHPSLPATVAGMNVNSWSSDEDTAELEPFTFDPSDDVTKLQDTGLTLGGVPFLVDPTMDDTHYRLVFRHPIRNGVIHIDAVPPDKTKP